jgi:hypothetical protein
MHLSFRELDLNRLIVQVQEAEAGLRPHPHHGDIQVQLGLSSLVCIQVVTRGKRPIRLRRSPIVYSSRFHRNVPVDVI